MYSSIRAQILFFLKIKYTVQGEVLQEVFGTPGNWYQVQKKKKLRGNSLKIGAKNSKIILKNEV